MTGFGCGKTGGRMSFLQSQYLLGGAAAPETSPFLLPALPQHIPIKVVAWALKASSVALADHHETVNHVCEQLMIGMVEHGCLGEVEDFVGIDGAMKLLWKERESILKTNLSPIPPCAGRIDAELTKGREPENTMFPERLQSKGSQPSIPCWESCEFMVCRQFEPQHIAVWWAPIRSEC